MITNANQAARLPVGTKLVSRYVRPIDGQLYEARKVAGCFRGDQAGWMVEGITGPVSDARLFLYCLSWEIAS